MRQCKDWLRTYVEYTSGQESPEVFHYWAGVSTICATLMRNTYVDMDYFKIYPNMYLVLVGPTGVGKSSASDIAIDLYSKAFPKRIVTRGKISVAKLIEDMGDEFTETGTASSFIYAPEFKVFTQALSTNTSIIEDLTDLYSCPTRWSYRTKTRGVVSLENVCINILGASIPEWLCTTSGENFINTGFAARILYIGARTSDRLFHKPRKPKGADAMEEALVHDLIQMSQIKGPYNITDKGDKLHHDWYIQAKSQETLNQRPEKLHGYIMRKDGHMLKLAMALKAATSNEPVLDEVDIKRAICVLESIEEGMMIAYQAIAFSSIEALVEKILAMLKSSKTGLVTHREIMRKVLGYKGFGGKGIDEVIEYMQKSGLVAVEPGRQANSTVLRLKLKEEDDYADSNGRDVDSVQSARP